MRLADAELQAQRDEEKRNARSFFSRKKPKPAEQIEHVESAAGSESERGS